MFHEFKLKTPAKWGTNDWNFDPKRLALVHITDYMPQKVGDHWEIQSTAEATDYIECRNTIHFTVGHHVESHFWGSWENKGIMVITPFMGVVDKNDKPLGMCSLDTWFETTPGHNLKLPKGTEIFVPVQDEKDLEGQLIKTEGDVTYYKTSHFTEEEKKQIFYAITHPNPYNYYEEVRVYGDIPTPDGYSEYKRIDWEIAKTLPDSFFAQKMKEVLLMNCVAKHGYLSNETWNFSSGSEDVANLGKELGCRFYGTWSDIHHNNNFEHKCKALARDLKTLDFIFHPEKYRVTGWRDRWRDYTISAGTKESTFYIDTDVDFEDSQDGKEIIETLAGIESKDWVEETVKEIKEYGEKAITDVAEYHQIAWSDAFKATYAVWAQKNIDRLHQYHAMSKDFDFEAWKANLAEKIKEYDANTRAKTATPFQGPPKGKGSR